MGGDKLWTEFENHCLNQGLSNNRIAKLKVMYNSVSRFIDLKTAKREQIEEYLNRLNRNQLYKVGHGQQNKKAPFSGTTKSDLKKFLKQYYKHTRGNDEFYPPEVAWICTKIRKDEKPTIKDIVSRDQVVKIARQFSKPEQRMMTLMLFDSGFRISEMFSSKKKHLTFESFDDEGNKCFWIECVKSKTIPRSVDLQLFGEDVKAFVKSTYYTSLNENDCLFGFAYSGYYNNLKRASKKAIGREISPHHLRHSSADLYAALLKGDVIKIANRYGWSYDARELKTYVRRSKTMHHQAAQITYSSEMIKLKQEMEDMKNNYAELKKFVMQKAKEDIKKAKY